MTDQEINGAKSKKRKIASDVLWEAMFQLLLDYGQINNNYDVPLSYMVPASRGRKFHLGEWLGTQRKYKRKGTLPEAKLTRLQGLVDAGKMTWGPAVSRLQSDNQHWDNMYTLLLEFGEREGHYNVPERYVVEDQPQQVLLGKWLGRQREQWRRGTLHSDRADRLQTLVNSGLFYTNGTAEDETRWQRHYEALLQFNEQFEHCNVPYSYYCCVPIETEAAAKGSPDNETKDSNNSRETEHFEVLKLGAWLNNQRQARRRSQQEGATSGQLRPDRLALLQNHLPLCITHNNA